jgi:tetratricopeptide (TPR) repeat protein
LGSIHEAIQEHRTAIDLDPKFALAHYGLGTALQAKQQLDAAIQEYRTAIDLDPKFALARVGQVLLARAVARVPSTPARQGYERITYALPTSRS